MENCSTNCCSGSSKVRRFLTKSERVEMLKEYKGTLEMEAQGVSEKIAKLEKD